MIGLLAVHAHPDDETISTGALLATWAAAGGKVTVVTCTRGERGEVIPAGLAHLAHDPASLAAHREVELAAALKALGVSDQLFLDQVTGPGMPPRRYTDSGMVWAGPGRAAPTTQPSDAFAAADVDEAAVRLAAVITDRRPAVVVGYPPDGGYGHPDHVHAHRVMHRAAELARGSAGNAPTVLWRVVSEPFDIRVDVVPVLGRVVAALEAHATQVQAVQVWPECTEIAVGTFALSNGVPQQLPRAESYRYPPVWEPEPGLARQWPIAWAP